MIGARKDEDVLRHAVESVLTADLTEEHGWREGTGYHLGLPKCEPDMLAGEGLVRRGIMVRSEGGRLTLSEAAVVRLFRVALDAAVADLMANDPPDEKLPTDEYDYENEGPGRLISLRGELTVRGWR